MDAFEKLDKELKEFKGDRYGTAVKKAVADALKEFCRQNRNFAAAVAGCEKTLSDCCANIMKGCGTAIQAMEVYQKAVRFYYPGANVRMSVTVELGDSNELAKNEDKPAAGGGIVLDLTDFL